MLVTGGSSGIGKAAAEALRDSGCIVYEGSRRESDLPGITHVLLDVTDERSVASAVEQVLEREGPDPGFQELWNSRKQKP